MIDVPEEIILGKHITKVKRYYTERLICRKLEVKQKDVKEFEN